MKSKLLGALAFASLMCLNCIPFQYSKDGVIWAMDHEHIAGYVK